MYHIHTYPYIPIHTHTTYQRYEVASIACVSRGIVIRFVAAPRRDRLPPRMARCHLHQLVVALVASFVVAVAVCSAPVAAVDYKPIVQSILAAASNNTEGFSRLAYMCDQFGPRLSGSKGLESALSWIEATVRAAMCYEPRARCPSLAADTPRRHRQMLSDQLDNVTAQPVMVPKVRRHRHRLQHAWLACAHTLPPDASTGVAVGTRRRVAAHDAAARQAHGGARARRLDRHAAARHRGLGARVRARRVVGWLAGCLAE